MARVQAHNPNNLDARLSEIENKYKECDQRLKDLSNKIENKFEEFESRLKASTAMSNTTQNTNNHWEEKISQEISQSSPDNPIIEENSENNVDNTMVNDNTVS